MYSVPAAIQTEDPLKYKSKPVRKLQPVSLAKLFHTNVSGQAKGTLVVRGTQKFSH